MGLFDGNQSAGVVFILFFTIVQPADTQDIYTKVIKGVI